MTPENAAFLACVIHHVMNHLMRDRMSKQDNDIRFPQTIAQRSAGLAEDFCLMSMFPAQVRIPSFHTLVSTNDHYTHRFNSSFLLQLPGSPFSPSQPTVPKAFLFLSDSDMLQYTCGSAQRFFLLPVYSHMLSSIPRTVPLLWNPS